MAMALEGNTDIFCSACMRDNEQELATNWCNECNEGLCQECCRYHKKNKTSSQHNCLPLDNIQNELLLLNKLQIDTQCKEHPEHPVIVFCKDDDLFCCTVCSSTIHRKCNNLQSIDDTVKAYNAEIRNKDIKDITDLKSKVIQIKKNQLNMIEKIKLETSTSIELVEREIISFIANLSLLKIKFRNEITMTQKFVKRIHSDKIIVCEMLEKTLDDCHLVLQADQKLSSVHSFMAGHKMLDLTQKQIAENMKIMSKKNLEMQISLRAKEIVTDVKFWNISTQHIKADNAELSTFCETIERVSMHQKNSGIAQIGRVPIPLISCDLNFVSSVERPHIRAGTETYHATYLPENVILLSDYTNKQLIMFDANLCLLKKLPVAGKPYGVCYSSDHKCVHVVCDFKNVVSYKLQGQWEEVNRFSTGGGAWAITSYGDWIVIGHEHCVIIYNTNGTQIGNIKLSKKWYEWTYQAFSHDGKMLYHSDGHDVVCRLMGNLRDEVWRYSSGQLVGPLGIVTDRDNNVLIAGHKSGNIHQISEDGKVSRVLMDKLKYIKSPRGLFYNRDTNTLGVTSRDDKTCVELYMFND